jgi:TonB family protein
VTDQFPTLLSILALKSTVLLTAAFGVAAAASRLSAAERHVGWFLALLGLLALPAVHLLGPSYPLPLPQMDVGAALDRTSARIDEADTAAALGTRTLNASGSESHVPGPPPPPSPSVDPSSSKPAFSVDMKLALIVSYLGIALSLIARWTVAALLVTRTVRKLPTVTHQGCRALLDEARRLTGVRRQVQLKSSAEHSTPWAWGWLRPVIVVPIDFHRRPVDAQRNAFVHELAHVARYDFVTAITGRFCCALYWVQPLAWLALRQLTRESERACDDRVLIAGGSSTAYASQLLDIARAIRRSGRPPALGTAMAVSSSVTQRITSILDTTVRRKTMSKTRVMLASLTAVALILPLAAVNPEARAQDAPPAIGDAELEALAQRGPASSDELEQLIRAYVAGERHADAVAAFVAYMGRGEMPGDETCEFCGSLLRSEGRAPRGAEFSALLAAFDELEQRAYAASDGDALLRLAAIAGASDNRDAMARGMLYLLEGFRLSDLTDDSKLTAVRFLQLAGHLVEARALAAQLHDDETSKFHESGATAGWLRYLDNELQREELIAARVLGAARLRDAESDEGDYLPLYKPSPRYPAEAAAQRREGSVILEFTVSERGKTEGVTVISSTDTIFEQAALEAATQFVYLPRVVSGVPVEVPGVRNKITFVLPPEA